MTNLKRFLSIALVLCILLAGLSTLAVSANDNDFHVSFAGGENILVRFRAGEEGGILNIRVPRIFKGEEVNVFLTPAAGSFSTTPVPVTGVLQVEYKDVVAGSYTMTIEIAGQRSSYPVKFIEY